MNTPHSTHESDRSTFQNRALMADFPGDWFVLVLAALVPLAAIVGSWRRYQKFVATSQELTANEV